MKSSLLLPAVATAVALLAGCGTNPPVPDWQMTAQSAVQRFTEAYLSGNTRVEQADYARARTALASTGRADMVLRAELTRCATRAASLVFEPCAGYEALAQDASAADQAYAAYLAGTPVADTTLLPAQHRAVAAAVRAGADANAAAAVQAIAEPLSKLVASGVLLRAGKATPQTLSGAVEAASAQGWRRPLLAWLGVQRQRAQQAGDTAEAQRLQRRIDLATEPAASKP